MSRTLERAIATCQNCRRRKIRCDRLQPRCTTCVERGQDCTYINKSDIPRQYTFINEDPASQQTDWPHQAERDPLPVPAQIVDNVEARISSLGNVINDLRWQNASGDSAQDPRPGRQSESGNQANHANGLGSLVKQSGGRMRYVEQGYWAYLCDEVSDLQELLANQNRYIPPRRHEPSSASPLNSRRESTRASSVAGTESSQAITDEDAYACTGLAGGIATRPSSATPSAQHLAAHATLDPTLSGQLPPREVCNALLEAYVQYSHSLVPILHLPTLHRDHERFWQYLDNPRIAPSGILGFTALYTAILFAGAVACPDATSWPADIDSSRQQAADVLYEMGLKALRNASFPRTATTDSLLAYLLLQQTWKREEEPLTCSAFIGLTLRIATSLGLHRDPSFLGIQNSIEAEVRRRLWWHIVRVDVLIAVAAGLPLLIDLSISDVDPMSDIRDDILTADLIVTPEMIQDESLTSTLRICFAGKIEGSLIMRKAWQAVTQPFRTSAYITKELLQANDEMREKTADRLRRIQQKELIAASQGYAETVDENQRLRNYSQLVLSAYLDRQLCTIGPSLARMSPQAEHSALNALCLRSAEHFLVKFFKVVTDEQFVHYRWSWPGQHQPLHALMIILIDILKKSPQNLQVPDVELVEIAFGLADPNGGIVYDSPSGITQRPLVEGGSETWAFLRRLRRKAWQKHGMDPDVIWMRSTAIQAATALSVDDHPERAAGAMQNQATSASTYTDAYAGGEHDDLAAFFADPANMLDGFPGFDHQLWYG